MGKCLFMRKGETHTDPGSRLPRGYTELVYIQSTGTQYVDTEWTANQNTSATIKFSTTQQSGGGILVAMQGWQNRGFGIFVNAIIFGSSTTDRNGMFGDGNIHEVTLTSGAKCYDNGSLIWSGTVSTFTTPVTLTICKSNVVSEAHEYSSAKIYSCQIYDNGTLVRDFVPCINDSGTVGLYDLVGKKFYGNSGTGAFGAGDVVEYQLPEGYEKLAYIRSSGTQYIDTQVPFSADNYNKIKLSVEMDAANAYHAYEVNGTGTSGSNCFYVGNYDGFVAYGNGGSDNIFGQVHQTGRCKYTIDAKNGIVSADGVDDVEFTSYAPSVSANICVCGFGRTSGTATGFSGKFYAAQILVDGAYSRLYVPCVTENGDVGMYDVITRTFYGNAGTGVFIGSEVA